MSVILIIVVVIVIVALAFVVSLFIILALTSIAAGSLLVAILAIVAPVVVLAILLWLIFGVQRLPLGILGLGGATHLPAIPFRLSDLPGTMINLYGKTTQFEQAMAGLSNPVTIGSEEENAYTMMGMRYSTPLGRAQDLRTQLPLDDPEQFKMSWTTFGDAARTYQTAEDEGRLPNWPATLTEAEAATREFWPTIANLGLAYNLLVLELVRPSDETVKNELDSDWTAEMEAAWSAGNLYMIDMRVFADLEAHEVNFRPRYTPATHTFLERTPGAPDQQTMRPIAVRVRDPQQNQMVQYVQSDPAWLYGLQAAKASVAVWGIWLGHVYQWHIVTAAMQMTMFQSLHSLHPVSQILGRQSDHLIGFDQFLLIDWNIAPPTSITTSRQFLSLLNTFANNRDFFHDDPPTRRDRLGLTENAFTDTTPWDQYRVMGYTLELYDAASAYVTSMVNAFYPADQQVSDDVPLQQWIKASGDPTKGNVRGLPDTGFPAMTTRAELIRVLASLIYRITAHGNSRLMQMANPGFLFAPNFPPCLQTDDVPSPDTPIEFKTTDSSPNNALSLSDFLPNTGTVGELVTFLYVFIYATPHEPFIPFEGTDTPAGFIGSQATVDACNDALRVFREDLKTFINRWSVDSGLQGSPAQAHQWELNIET